MTIYPTPSGYEIWYEEYLKFKEYFPNHPNPEHYPKTFENLVKQYNYRNKRRQEITNEKASTDIQVPTN